jgi:hypothetical protein
MLKIAAMLINSIRASKVSKTLLVN